VWNSIFISAWAQVLILNLSSFTHVAQKLKKLQSPNFATIFLWSFPRTGWKIKAIGLFLGHVLIKVVLAQNVSFSGFRMKCSKKLSKVEKIKKKKLFGIFAYIFLWFSRGKKVSLKIGKILSLLILKIKFNFHKNFRYIQYFFIYIKIIMCVM
jgi:hypothetical protein